MDTKKKAKARARIKTRVRGRVQGTPERPRLTVFRSNKQITLRSLTTSQVARWPLPLPWEETLHGAKLDQAALSASSSQRRRKLQESLKLCSTATGTSTTVAFKNSLKQLVRAA